MLEKCPVTGCCFRSRKSVAATVTRVSLGLSLLFMGISHYQGMSGFVAMTASDLGPLSFLGTIWAYILPLLMIAGGIGLIWKKFMLAGVWCSAIALGSIPAGLLLKPVITNNPESAGLAMQYANNAFMWLIVLLLTVKMTSCCNKGMCAPGAGACGCGGTCEKCKSMAKPMA